MNYDEKFLAAYQQVINLAVDLRDLGWIFRITTNGESVSLALRLPKVIDDAEGATMGTKPKA